jgi:hypothetical protein
MASLVKSSRSGGLLVRVLLHLKGLANRLREISSGGRAAPNVSCGYAANIDGPIFRCVQNVGGQLNLDGPVNVAKSRNPIKVQE